MGTYNFRDDEILSIGGSFEPDEELEEWEINEEEKLIKFTFSKRLYLKKEFKGLYENDNPNKFIISLFKGGEN